MKTTVSILFFLLGGTFLMTSCTEIFNNSISGSGNVVTEKRAVGTFSAIEAETGLNVIVRFEEPSGEVEVVADDNLQPYIHTELHGDLLKIKSDRSIRHARSKDVYVSAGSLKEIRVSSAANLTGENKLVTHDLQVDVSSAADLDLDLEAGTVNVNVSSSGKANLSGKTDRLVAHASSAGHLNADNLEAGVCEVDASSAGEVNLNVTTELSASASSAGSIRYKGNPEIKKLESSSAGSVSKK